MKQVSQAILIALGLNISIPGHAAESKSMSCEIAEDLAGKSYTRAANAKNANNLVAAHQYKLAFWDLFEYSAQCEKVALMAGQLRAYRLGEKDTEPSAQEKLTSLTGPSGLNLPSGCFSGGTVVCRIIVTEPGKGKSAGMEAPPHFYLLQEKNPLSVSKTPSWQKFSEPKLQFPSTGQLGK